MSLPTGLDADLLRSFVFVGEELNFTRAGQRVGRTQAAVSMQMQKLESLLGQTLLKRGRGEAMALTPQGIWLMERARAVLAMNDEVWRHFLAPAVSGKVRIGTPDDYALQFLPAALRRFAESHPAVEVEVVCLPSNVLIGRLRDDALDLALISEGYEVRPFAAEKLISGPLVWVTSQRFSPHRLDPLPLALAEHGCSWRRAALQGLDASGRRYRIAYTAASATGSLVPVVAGLAVTCAIAAPLPEGVRVLPPQEENLPQLPDFSVLMLQGRNPPQPVTEKLAEHIREAAAREMPGGFRA